MSLHHHRDLRKNGPKIRNPKANSFQEGTLHPQSRLPAWNLLCILHRAGSVPKATGHRWSTRCGAHCWRSPIAPRCWGGQERGLHPHPTPFPRSPARLPKDVPCRWAPRIACDTSPGASTSCPSQAQPCISSSQAGSKGTHMEALEVQTLFSYQHPYTKHKKKRGSPGKPGHREGAASNSWSRRLQSKSLVQGEVRTLPGPSWGPEAGLARWSTTPWDRHGHCQGCWGER